MASNAPLPRRPRILNSNAHKFVGKNVTVIGEVTNITPHANTITLRLPDDESIIVLLQRNSTTIEPGVLTEVCGKLVSRGQIEAMSINQWSQKATALFKKDLYNEAMLIKDAYDIHFDV